MRKFEDGWRGKIPKKTNKKRQLKLLGHIVRREGVENLTTTGMIESKKGRGRPRENTLTDY